MESDNVFPVQELQEESKQPLIDALPYADENILESSELSRQVESLLQTELSLVEKKSWEEQQSKSLFLDSLVGIEVQRMEEGLPSEYEDPFKRYQVSYPSGTKEADVHEWEKSIHLLQTSLEHDLLCLANLELLKRYGSQSWLLFVSQLEKQVQRHRIMLNEEKNHIDEVNVRRKKLQEGALRKLTNLDRTWKQLIRKNKQIELACSRLEAEIRHLKETA
ncbi:Pre-mRNA-splicing factor SPF27 [Galdieria sulphuraria]|uniref:Pre-mRNA-splicing factor SPF27 n=1 Tax=Galdieria sulphuraria TaxID=130081 RepID=M2XHI3_GALSU|nr:pre-mRNA-splicing factor SPF27 [Galdieria sulphuraria]EME29542.1 pre-mRNA-splicing factor SPF27 [Galdieria sulphuraria]GJD12865.1 Pre-mRNA-splicing factor SPF27 [Galdieria sulphuraria]|eukprot:XP_005706062.1 pre-mRNA-splicing factor SPF27 [Galdieria sulphuraria]